MKNYKLLTTAIVTALDASNPTRIGAVWTPTEVPDISEAKALVLIGVAEETKAAADTQTVAERRANAVPKPAPLSGIVDATRQEDGTFVNKNGQRVNEDGSDYQETDDDKAAEVARESRLAYLARPADEVIASLAELPDEHKAVLPALHELEKQGKNRKTVLEAILNASKSE
jgi:hypothetical protein